MDERKLIKYLLKEIGWSQERLAKEAGFARQSNITGMLNNNKSGMKVANLYTLLDAMGYELVVRDKLNKKLEWTITKEVSDGKED